MRKSAIAMTALIALSLSGCAAAGGGESERPSLLIWVDTPREAAANAYAESVKDTVDVKVEVMAQTDFPTKIALHNQTKSGWPDVVFGSASDTATYMDPSNGFAAPLTDLVSDEVIEGYGEANDECKFDDTYYCLKNDLAQSVLWYNVPLMEELGLSIPTTMSEFAEEAMKLEGTGYVVGAIGDQSYYANYLQSSGCPLSAVPEPDVIRIAPDAPECQRVTDLVQPLVDAGVIDTRSNFDAGFIKDVAQQNKVVMTIGPSWFGDFVMKPADSWALPEGEIAAAPMPSWDGADANTSGQWGGGVFTVSSHSKFPEDAAAAAVWLATSPEAQTDAPTFPAFGPANELWKARLADDPFYAEDPYPAMAEQANKISQVDRPVRLPFTATVQSDLQAPINAGASLDAALHQFADALAQLAPVSGYTVESK